MFLCLTSYVLAQNPIVQANLILFPPHAPNIYDFGSTVENKLQLTMLLNDAPQPFIQVRLKLRIEGPGFTLETFPGYAPPLAPSFLLPNNMMQTYIGADLSNYFNPQFLVGNGISTATLMQNGGQLPEGLYTVCFQAFDKIIGNTAYSNETCATAMLSLPDPPILMAPTGNINATDPQSVLFNWVPQHPGNILVVYQLQVWENDPNLSQQQIIDNTPPFFQTTTSSTSFVYGPAEPGLTIGQDYITRVRVVDLNGSTLFDNDGYSELETFTWILNDSPPCNSPINLQAAVQSNNDVILSWDAPTSLPASFLLEYQNVTNNGDWVAVTVPNNNTSWTVSELTTANDYNFRLRSECPDGSSDWTTIGPITISQNSGSSCPVPENVVAARFGLNSIKITWDHPSVGPADSYLLRYRDITAFGEWTNLGIPNSFSEWTLQNLLVTHEYEIELKANCPDGNSEWVSAGSIYLSESLPNDDQYECNAPIGVYPVDNLELLSSLSQGEIFYAGDFEVIVSSISGSNGTFFGKGYVKVPYLNGARLNVKFSGININTDYYLINDGSVVVTGYGLKLLSDDMANLLEDIMSVVNTIADLLAAAEAILNAIDEILAEIEPYLPDHIIQDLLAAQQLLEAALQAQANGDSNADQLLQDAKDALDAANDAYKQAVLAFLEQFADIIRLTLEELHDDYINQVSNLESDYNTKQITLDGFVDPYYSDMLNGSTIVEEDVEIEVELLEQPLDSAAVAALGDAEITEYFNKSKQYLAAAKSYRVAELLSELNAQLPSDADISYFGDLLKQVEFDILHFVGTRIKEEIPEAQIVDELKVEIIRYLELIVIKVAASNN